MALIAMRQLLDHAAENNYGVPAEGRSSACGFLAGLAPDVCGGDTLMGRRELRLLPQTGATR